MSVTETIAIPVRRPYIFALGLLAGFLAPLVFGEVYVRLRPPPDLQEYLGEESPLSGIYLPDPKLIVRYASLADYKPSHAARFTEVQPFNSPEPTWLFFGNSFAYGLSLAAKLKLPSERIFYLQERKDRLHQRVAQARLLLENGLRPERIIFTLIPLEIAKYVKTPLSSININQRGALVTKVRMPGEPLNTLLANSRLALIGWVRSGLHHQNPTFQLSKITETVPENVKNDFQTMFQAMGELSRRFNVPVTVIVMPDRRQILFQKSAFAMQRTLMELCKQAGIDGFEPSAEFLSYSDRRALFLPDWHHTPLGNGIIMDALLAHFKKSEKENRSRTGEAPK
jgi:hypothetical protein